MLPQEEELNAAASAHERYLLLNRLRRAVEAQDFEAYDAYDPCLFASAIDFAVDELTCSKVAILFMVSQPAVKRWAQNKALPHPLIKRRIYEVLLTHLASPAATP